MQQGKIVTQLIEGALEIEPGNGFYLDSLGWVHYRKGNAEKAISLIRSAILAMDTDDSIVRDHLGDAYLLKGDVEKALAQWRRALRIPYYICHSIRSQKM